MVVIKRVDYNYNNNKKKNDLHLFGIVEMLASSCFSRKAIVSSYTAVNKNAPF